MARKISIVGLLVGLAAAVALDPIVVKTAAQDYSHCNVVASTGRATVAVGCNEQRSSPPPVAKAPPQVVYVPVYVPVYQDPPPTPAARPTPTAVPEPTARPRRERRRERTPTPEPRGDEFVGTGPTATDPFTLDAGLAVFTLEHDGASNFAVVLYDGAGEYVDLLVNEIGEFSGETAVALPAADDYTLNVEADGTWRITFDQEIPASGDPVPTEFEGEGAAVSPFLEFDEGLVRFRLTHDGSSNFAVVLYGADGEYIDLLVNEVGRFRGSQAVSIEEPGLYVLDIDADGAWSVAVE